jgi:hypothetical protein
VLYVDEVVASMALIPSKCPCFTPVRNPCLDARLCVAFERVPGVLRVDSDDISDLVQLLDGLCHPAKALPGQNTMDGTSTRVRRHWVT